MKKYILLLLFCLLINSSAYCLDKSRLFKANDENFHIIVLDKVMFINKINSTSLAVAFTTGDRTITRLHYKTKKQLDKDYEALSNALE